MPNWLPSIPAQSFAFVDALRLLFLISCVAGTCVLWHYSPGTRAHKYACAAAGLVHFTLTVILDLILTYQQVYQYGFEHGLVCGIPLDFHIAWAFLWGTGFLLAWAMLKPRLRWLLYFGLVTGTFGCDLIAVQFGVVLKVFSESWLVWDLGALVCLPLIMLGFSNLVERNKWLGVRALAYALWYFLTFYWLIPLVILGLTGSPIELSWIVSPNRSLNLLNFVALGQGMTPSPGFDFSREIGFIEHLGILYLCLFFVSLPGLWATWEIWRKGKGTPLPWDPSRELVTSGPYRYVRNPMQISGVGVAVVWAAVTGSVYLWFYALDMLILLWFMNRWEDAELAARFAAPYLEYAKKVPRWIPKVPRV